MARTALITHADGPTGTALLEHLVHRTTSDEWERIVVNSHPGNPKRSISDARIQYVQLDFAQRPGTLIEQMTESCSTVTHAYFCSYAHENDLLALNKANTALFENFLLAISCVTPGLENVTLQTSSRYYGCHICPVPTPCREEDPRRGDEEDNFFYAQEDFLRNLQMNQRWTWNVVRPEVIVSSTLDPLVPNPALTLAMYFLVTRELAVEARMPTNQRYWNCTEGVSDATLLAQFTIWLSGNAECANQVFNFANGDHFMWRFMWPRLAEYFSAYATPDQSFSKTEPEVGESQQEFSLTDWLEDKKPVWERICDMAGVPKAMESFGVNSMSAPTQDAVFSRSWSATLSMNKARKYGWTGFADSFDSFVQAFEELKVQQFIP